MEHLGSPGPRPGWSIQTTGVLSKGHTKGSSGRWWGVSCSQVLLGSHYQELVFACDSAGGYLGHAVRGGEGGLVSVQGPCRPVGHTKCMLRHQYQGVV